MLLDQAFADDLRHLEHGALHDGGVRPGIAFDPGDLRVRGAHEQDVDVADDVGELPRQHLLLALVRVVLDRVGLREFAQVEEGFADRLQATDDSLGGEDAAVVHEGLGDRHEARESGDRQTRLVPLRRSSLGADRVQDPCSLDRVLQAPDRDLRAEGAGDDGLEFVRLVDDDGLSGRQDRQPHGHGQERLVGDDDARGGGLLLGLLGEAVCEESAALGRALVGGNRDGAPPGLGDAEGDVGAISAVGGLRPVVELLDLGADGARRRSL
ncbi:hypothetical protein [Frondihabitans sucicola]|uniref:hypothetical protein n=1 Tax=Frondihabitans sucicola TaxID=1268041 RepID=UPI0033057E20